MLSKKFQKMVFEAFKKGEVISRGDYEYFIQHNPIAVTKTWIVRRKKTRLEWTWMQPLDLDIN